jgi:hypothetical protein
MSFTGNNNFNDNNVQIASHNRLRVDASWAIIFYWPVLLSSILFLSCLVGGIGYLLFVHTSWVTTTIVVAFFGFCGVGSLVGIWLTALFCWERFEGTKAKVSHHRAQGWRNQLIEIKGPAAALYDPSEGRVVIVHQPMEKLTEKIYREGASPSPSEVEAEAELSYLALFEERREPKS